MKSPASGKCVGGLFVALAIASISLMTACGSSNIPTPNQGGFGDSNLTGTYVISISGTDLNNSSQQPVPFAIAGIIVADGKGGIQSGTLDINDLGGLGVNPGVAVNPTGSGYSISPDGRGTGTLATSIGTFNIDFVLATSSHGLISRFDTLGTGSGTIDVQVPTPSIAGSYAFSLAGADFVENSNGNPLATVGAFTVSGNSIGGTEDFNNNGSSGGLIGLALSGQVTAGAAGAPSTATLTTGFGSLGFDVWVIDSTHLKFIETDTNNTGIVLAGDAFTQATSVTPGQLVFVLSGMDSSGGPISAGGYATTDASANLTNGVEDYNDAGTVALGQPFSTSAASCVPGRCQLSLAGFSNGALNNFAFAAYPSSNGGIQLLEIDSLGLLQGAAFSQSATAFTPSGGYALNLSGANTFPPVGVVNDIAQFDAGPPDTSFTGAANMTGLLDESNLGVPPITSTMVGAYVPDTTADGRGSVSSTNQGTELGGFTLQYYVVDSATVVFIDVDSFADSGGAAAQLGVGTFEAQNSAASAVAQNAAAQKAAAQSHIAIVHPPIRPHGAFQRK
ncbi:MAG TPA: hypothetical protein VK828_06305 [Terriglobales bacterium]|jgi:hypothetical protein|nr:hypothetical protein [Terriglobales bacterium]